MRSSLQLATLRNFRSIFPHSVVAAAAAAAEERLVKNVQTTLISNVEVKNDGEFFAFEANVGEEGNELVFSVNLGRKSEIGAEAAIFPRSESRGCENVPTKAKRKRRTR